MLRRLTALAGAAVATLAFAASAHASPTAPIIKPIPTNVCGPSVNVGWSASTSDPGGTIVQYRIDVGDLTAGTAGFQWVNGLGTTVGGLITNHHYIVRVRALQYRNGALTWSPTSYRTFYRACLVIAPDKLKQYVAYNPFPECIMCGGLKALQIEDPEIYRAVSAATPPAADKLRGLQLEGDGSIFEL